MEDFNYKGIAVKVGFCGKAWGVHFGQIRFEYLNKTDFFDSYLEGVRNVEIEIEEVLKTDYTSHSIEKVMESIENCFYTDEGGSLYRDSDMLKNILKNLNSKW